MTSKAKGDRRDIVLACGCGLSHHAQNGAQHKGERTMQFRPLHADLGVEVTGFDLQRGGSAAEVEALRQAYDQHQMLLFRGGGRVSHERHVEISSWFGPPSPVDNSGK